MAAHDPDLPPDLPPDPQAAWVERRRALADTLGLPEPIPDAVLSAALSDEFYAQRLLAARRNPAILRMLLARPPAPPDGAPSGLQLLGKAAVALARWSAQGFASADPATLARRRDACAACEHAQLPPRTALYALAGQLDRAVCGLCGCNLAAKTRLPGERCPGPDPDRPGLTRWGDPLAPAPDAAPGRPPDLGAPPGRPGA